ncbi:MAG: nucleoside phosphorylase, partial [Rikenellaceae bacterium]|nr:nucleoside phosphorylase [Rikenellaceae bacterium]
PGRVDMVGEYLEDKQFRHQSREFVSITGKYKGVRITVLSTGIGTDNIDIVMNELDALVNIDFDTRTVRGDRTSLTILRLGTSGAVSADIPLGSFVMASHSIGTDPLARYYKGASSVCDVALEEAFMKHIEWPDTLSRPYAVEASPVMRRRFEPIATEGLTLSAPGFYAPQGRQLALRPEIEGLTDKIESFRHNGRAITNIEMESASIAFMAALMGHHALTICLVIAQRHDGESDVNYNDSMNTLIAASLALLA